MTIERGRAVVFLGPSLPVEQARAVLDADFRPPIRRGDVDALLGSPPEVIGVVDGLFFQSLSISPKELLRALDRGVVVFGASSMGALRAAELHPFAMRGVGQIFELFRSGRLEADDEVAMIHSEGDWRPLSEPLVNMRIALLAAAREGIISHDDRRRLLRIARGLYFPERSYARVLAIGGDTLGPARVRALRTFVAERAPDAKRSDALQLLAEVRRHMSGPGGAGANGGRL